MQILVSFSSYIHSALVLCSNGGCFVLVLAVNLMHCMFNVGISFFFLLNKLLVLSTEGGIIYCQQLLFPESAVICLEHALPPQLPVEVFVLSSDYRTACHLASCKSNLPFGQLNLPSGRNI